MQTWGTSPEENILLKTCKMNIESDCSLTVTGSELYYGIFYYRMTALLECIDLRVVPVVCSYYRL